MSEEGASTASDDGAGLSMREGGTTRFPSENGASPARRPRRIGRAIAVIVAAIVVAAAVFVGYSVWNGDMAPSDAAAKYDGFNYVPESEVTDYINVYRSQMGLGDSSDEDWAAFLAEYNLTPQRLRHSTIRQLITDALVQRKADELGIAASEEEVEQTIDTLRNTLGMGDDEILQQTLAAHGQSLEGLREVYRKAIVKRLVLTAEVEVPTPTDDQVKSHLKTYITTLSTPTVRHTYCFKLDGVAESGDSDKVKRVQELRSQFASGEKTADAFSAMVKANSNDERLAESGGANGWDIDASDYSNTYVGVLEGLGEGDVSDVFRDGESCCFIWVDDEYTLPVEASAIDALDLSTMPESLHRFLSDSAAHELWEQAGQDYLDSFIDTANIVYYPMPNDVPYNVDMGLADGQGSKAANE